MANIETLRRRAMRLIEEIKTTVQPIELRGADDAVQSADAALAALGEIDVPAYLQMRREKLSTWEVFDRPYQQVRERLNGTSILSVQCDIRTMTSSLKGGTDNRWIPALRRTRSLAERAKNNVDLMRRDLARTLMSGWVVALILLLALLWAGIAIVMGAQAEAPASPATVPKVVEHAKSGSQAIAMAIQSGNDPLGAASKFLTSLTDLISEFPPLIAAIGAAWAAGQKFIKAT